MVTRRRTNVQRKPKDAYHHGDLKPALKQAALELVRSKGARGFSLNEASRLAGVSVAAPYRHFADREALLAEIACEGNELMVRELRAATATVDDPQAKMVAAGLAYLRFAELHADFFNVIFNAGLQKAKYPALEESARQAYAVIQDLARKADPVRERADLHALTAWALVHGLATLRAERTLESGNAPPFGESDLQVLLEQFVKRTLS